MVEQLLAVGAPVAFHWVADRQTGPSVARFGTEEQKRFFLPRIARGELSFCIGCPSLMPGPTWPASAPGPTGRRRLADQRDEGVDVVGRMADYVLGLFRTSPERYGGLTQMIVPLTRQA